MKLADRASDPSTPAAEIARLAARFPERVLENPALPLLALEAPAAWADAIETAGAKAIAARTKDAPTVARLFAVACAERMLLEGISSEDATLLGWRSGPGADRLEPLITLARCHAHEALPAFVVDRILRRIAEKMYGMGWQDRHEMPGETLKALRVCFAKKAWDAAKIASRRAAEELGGLEGRSVPDERAWQLEQLRALLASPPPRPHPHSCWAAASYLPRGRRHDPLEWSWGGQPMVSPAEVRLERGVRAEEDAAERRNALGFLLANVGRGGR